MDPTSAREICAIEDATGTNPTMAPALVSPPTIEQICLGLQRCPSTCIDSLFFQTCHYSNICSCKIAKEAWDTLATLYYSKNKPYFGYLKKIRESAHE